MSQKRTADIRLLLVVCLYCLAGLWGAMQVVVPYSEFWPYVGIGYAAAAAFLASCGVAWAALDARARSHALLPIVQFVMFLSWPLSLVVYLFWSRGPLGLGWALAHAAGLMLTAAIFFYATILLVFGPLGVRRRVTADYSSTRKAMSMVTL